MNKAMIRHHEKFTKTDLHYKKRMARRSIEQYAVQAERSNLEVSILGAHLPTVLEDGRQQEADAKMAIDLQIMENQKEQANVEIDE